jgi:hypothetical protein
MMQFKLWFENLIFDKDHQTPSRYLDFLDDSEKQNPQKLAWLNKLSSHKIYKFPLAKEKFIHFSLTNDIEDIQRANGIADDLYPGQKLKIPAAK